MMSNIKRKALRTVMAETLKVRAVWITKQESPGIQQCGDIQLREHLPNPYKEGESESTWWYYIKVNGRWQKAWLRQRSWGYASANQAKLGFNKIREFVY